MALGGVAGMPDYTSAGSSKFIPEIWSGKLLVKFYAATVFGEISNTDYEGEIKEQGNKIIIRTIPTLTIKPYKKGTKLVYERPESPNVEMVIDRGQYFAFVCDDVDKYQSDIKLLDNWSKDASEQMKITIDTELLAAVPADAHANNTGLTAGKLSASFNLGVAGTALQLTKINVLDVLIDAGTVLDEQNVPEDDRWIVLPSWVGGLIKKSDLKDASLTGDSASVMRNGRIGRIDRWTIYLSNNLPYVIGDTAWKMPFGHKSAISFASQMTKMETLRAESTFGQLVRGLNIYDFKTLKSESLGVIYGKK